MDMVNRVVWFITTFFILCSGLFFSFRLGFIQLRFVSMFKAMFKGRGSSLSLLMTSLAGRIGVGSIAGVSLSIYFGGVGSIFWMWVSTILCGVITYVEVVLGIKYREARGRGFVGGPSYYLRDGLGNSVLGSIFSVLMIVSYIGCFLSIQSNTIARSLMDVFPFSNWVIGLCIFVVTFFCISGGFKKIVSVSIKLVPVMTIIYVGSVLYVLFINFGRIGGVFNDILRGAFNVKSLFSGFIPMVIIGFQRGIFSNEAGMGTSSIVASSGYDNDYKREGLIQVFGIYITTIVICTSTALILLMSDYGSLSLTDVNGIELALYAFKFHFGKLGVYIMLVSVILFSFSTIITGYYYGESCLLYFFDSVNKRYVYILRGVALVILFVGCLVSSNFLWNLVDILVGIMILINLYAMFRLKDKIL